MREVVRDGLARWLLVAVSTRKMVLEVMHKKRLVVFAVLAKLVQYPLMATVYAKLPSVRKKKRLFNCLLMTSAGIECCASQTVA
jgi:hypothetical protein